MALLEILAGLLEALIEMPDAALPGLIDLPANVSSFPAIRGEMQLGLKFGPSCETLIQFRLGHEARGGQFKVFGFRHRS